MRTKTVRILNIVAGILLIAAGIYCLCNEDVAVLSAGLMLGIFMLAAGIAEIVVFAGTSGMLIGSGWLLLDGVLTVIMSLFLLFNQWFTLLSLPFLFTVWLMFSGISRFVSAFDLHALGVRGWGWVLAVGILLMGAEILFYPTAIGSEPILDCDSMPHWRRCMQGHAAANIMPLIAANRIGTETVQPSEDNQQQSSSLTFYGSSFIADETGALVEQADRENEGVLTHTFDLDAIREMRHSWGVFRDRRPEMYGALKSFGR